MQTDTCARWEQLRRRTNHRILQEALPSERPAECAGSAYPSALGSACRCRRWLWKLTLILQYRTHSRRETAGKHGAWTLFIVMALRKAAGRGRRKTLENSMPRHPCHRSIPTVRNPIVLTTPARPGVSSATGVMARHRAGGAGRKTARTRDLVSESLVVDRECPSLDEGCGCPGDQRRFATGTSGRDLDAIGRWRYVNRDHAISANNQQSQHAGDSPRVGGPVSGQDLLKERYRGSRR
jgi:hypothetical protein